MGYAPKVVCPFASALLSPYKSRYVHEEKLRFYLVPLTKLSTAVVPKINSLIYAQQKKRL